LLSGKEKAHRAVTGSYDPIYGFLFLLFIQPLLKRYCKFPEQKEKRKKKPPKFSHPHEWFKLISAPLGWRHV
jgi:hypothetical protein